MNVPIVTYHEPQIKYWRNIMELRMMLVFGFIMLMLRSKNCVWL
jgi:hypothetical protein